MDLLSGFFEDCLWYCASCFLFAFPNLFHSYTVSYATPNSLIPVSLCFLELRQLASTYICLIEAIL